MEPEKKNMNVLLTRAQYERLVVLSAANNRKKSDQVRHWIETTPLPASAPAELPSPLRRSCAETSRRGEPAKEGFTIDPPPLLRSFGVASE